MITPPQFGQELTASFPSQEMREALLLRRSTQADMLGGGAGPDEKQLQDLLTIAARVPDHRRVVPFRFIVFKEEARARAGKILGKCYKEANPEASKDDVAREEKRFLRAPTIIAVVSKVDSQHKTPEWEQILTAGAVCENLLLASSSYGFAAQWLTEWYAYNRDVLQNFGLVDAEKIAGFIYIGEATKPPKERKRPVLDELISVF